MAKIKFKIAAKTDVGLVRTNNEDNFQASSNLSVKPMKWVNNEVCLLSEKGALLVVADGMGGMNAGEIASRIAIDVVRKEFSPENLSSEITKSRFSIEKFMSEVVIKADHRIKEIAKTRTETKGMGTTIVIAWLYDDTLYVTWCGDSRAYIYNQQYGLKRLTKDHSYVQQLIDSGKLTNDEAFDFPDSNIITRCLSDSKQKAQPDSLSRPYKVCDHDVILLCTDGLCGMIRDSEIQSVIELNISDLGRMADSLVQASLNASGEDNVTVCLCQIMSGGSNTNPKYFLTSDRRNHMFHGMSRLFHDNLKMILLSLLCLITGGSLSTIFFFDNSSSKDNDSNKDSISITKEQIGPISEPLNILEERSEPQKETNNIGNENGFKSIDNHIVGISIPNTERDTVNKTKSDVNILTSNEEIEQVQEQREELREIIEVTLPEGISLQAFALQYGMNSSDMKHLNPDIKNWDAVKPGTKLNVYKE